MDNEKWTHEVKNNDLADGLEDCKIFENTLDNNLVEKNEENKNICGSSFMYESFNNIRM